LADGDAGNLAAVEDERDGLADGVVASLAVGRGFARFRSVKTSTRASMRLAIQ